MTRGAMKDLKVMEKFKFGAFETMTRLQSLASMTLLAGRKDFGSSTCLTLVQSDSVFALKAPAMTHDNCMSCMCRLVWGHEIQGKVRLIR